MFKIPVLKKPLQKKPEPLFDIEDEEKNFPPRKARRVLHFGLLLPGSHQGNLLVQKSRPGLPVFPIQRPAKMLMYQHWHLQENWTGMPGPGRGARSRDPVPVEDPFLSLSSDELETGLLDTIDPADLETETVPAPAPEGATPLSDSAPMMDATSGLAIGEADIPLPPQELSAEPAEGEKATVPGN